VGCYDCGDSIRFKQRFPECQVYSFEASPSRHTKLETVALKYNLNLVKKAVCDVDGTAEFYDSLVDNEQVDAQGSFFKHTEIYKTTNPRIEQKLTSVTVETTTLNSFCMNNNITEIDLLYVDVEGAELQVIKGMCDYRPKIIFVETLDLLNSESQPMWVGATQSKDLEEYILSLGYKLGKILPADRLYFHSSVLEN